MIEWIKVTDRLPEAGSDPVSYRDVLVWTVHGDAEIAYYNTEAQSWIQSFDDLGPDDGWVTHWAEINPPNAA